LEVYSLIQAINRHSTIFNQQRFNNQRSKILKSDITVVREEPAMRTVIVFVTGLAIGTAMSPLLAQGDRAPINNMNHVAIAYENFDEAFDFYTKKMGFKEGFTVRNAEGQPTLSYIQASRDTFIEIQPANANRRPGLNHYGLHVADLKSYVAALKQRGVTVEDVRERPDDSSVANATDPAGVRIEMFQFGPGSAQGKAIASWK
jgi:catechol 2,3-dioxygenase-like lactoylglutathione lyase family enzyme